MKIKHQFQFRWAWKVDIKPASKAVILSQKTNENKKFKAIIISFEKEFFIYLFLSIDVRQSVALFCATRDYTPVAYKDMCVVYGINK